jgi:multiple sugar transport system permease protein
VVVLIIRGTDAFRVFDIIYALTNGGPANSTLSLSIYAFNKGFEQYEMGYAMAISIIMMVVLSFLFGPLLSRSRIRA